MYAASVLGARVSLLDLLEAHPVCVLSGGFSFASFIAALPPLRPRSYSISSSPLLDARRVTLTVAVLDAPARSGMGRFRGVCSTFLAATQPGAHVHAAVHASRGHFKLPPRDVEMVLIAAGRCVCGGGGGVGLAAFPAPLYPRQPEHFAPSPFPTAVSPHSAASSKSVLRRLQRGYPLHAQCFTMAAVTHRSITSTVTSCACGPLLALLSFGPSFRASRPLPTAPPPLQRAHCPTLPLCTCRIAFGRTVQSSLLRGAAALAASVILCVVTLSTSPPLCVRLSRALS